jgi:hypothetical protein
MATPLDMGILQSFQSVFPFLFTFLIVYGVLSYTKILGENKAIPALLAALLAIVTLFSSVALKTINMMAPWFVLLFVFGIFLLIAYQLFGVKEESISGLWKNWEGGGSTVFYWVLTFVLIIGLGSLLTVLKEEHKAPMFVENATVAAGAAVPQVSFWTTILNPKVLGAALLLLIAMFAIKNLTQGPSK